MFSTDRHPYRPPYRLSPSPTHTKPPKLTSSRIFFYRQTDRQRDRQTDRLAYRSSEPELKNRKQFAWWKGVK